MEFATRSCVYPGDLIQQVQSLESVLDIPSAKVFRLCSNVCSAQYLHVSSVEPEAYR
jgi:hypothetical protein